MTNLNAIDTITTTTTTSISLSKLTPSPANVRRTGAGAGIEALAASIAAHGLLQSLVVRATPGSDAQAGRFEVVAGARRLAALKLLVKQRRIGKGTAIPCRVLDADGVHGSEASLAENTVRQDMHPADQFEAFAGLHESGLGIEDIAARFGVSAHTVRQRLRLAILSPVLIQAYRDEALTLDHLTAFAVTEDQEAQERVFGQLQDWQRSPDTIRRLLTHALVPANDRKALFVGLDAYAAAGGTVQRDLFSEDRGGWIADPALLERLVAERMEREAGAVRAEGWSWVAIGQDAQTAAWGLRRVWPEKVALSPEDEQHRDALASRYDALAEKHRSADDLPDDGAAELAGIEAALAALEAKQNVYRAEDVARAGVVITLAVDGSLRIERGFVRPGDEAQSTSVTAETDIDTVDSSGDAGTAAGADEAPIGGTVTPIRGGTEPEDKAPAPSAALLAELEAHRTAGLQAAIAGQSELALRVLLHALATEAFYQRYGDTVMSLHTYPPALASACPGIADSSARQVITAAEDAWRVRLPREHGALWGWLQDQGATVLLDLLALCVARTVTAGCRSWTTPEGSQCIGARVAAAAGLDMRQSWRATKESYLGRVPKALILDAVREGAGAGVAGRIANSKKEVMVADAAQLLDGTGWLPALLRMPDSAARSYSKSAQAASHEPVPMAAE